MKNIAVLSQLLNSKIFFTVSHMFEVWGETGARSLGLAITRENSGAIRHLVKVFPCINERGNVLFGTPQISSYGRPYVEEIYEFLPNEIYDESGVKSMTPLDMRIARALLEAWEEFPEVENAPWETRRAVRTYCVLRLLDEFGVPENAKRVLNGVIYSDYGEEFSLRHDQWEILANVGGAWCGRLNLENVRSEWSEWKVKLGI